MIDIVNRLLEIIKPQKILLGKKDFQQLFLITKHIKKNKINTRVIPCKTIRDKNNIALSSRNLLLNKLNLKIAANIYKQLVNIKLKQLSTILNCENSQCV